MRRTVLVGVLLGACALPAVAHATTWVNVVSRSTTGTKGCAEVSQNQLGKHCMSKKWPRYTLLGTPSFIPRARLRLVATGKLGQVGRRITCTSISGNVYEANYYPLNGPYVPLGTSYLPLLPHKFVNLKGQTIIPASCTVVVYMVNPAYGKVTATIQKDTP